MTWPEVAALGIAVFGFLVFMAFLVFAPRSAPAPSPYDPGMRRLIRDFTNRSPVR